MKKKRLLIILGSTLLIGGILYAQAPFGNGEKEKPTAAKPESKALRLAHDIYREMVFPERDGVCAMDFTITTVDQSFKQLDTAVSSIHYLADRDRVHYRSEQMSFFQDRSIVLAVIPERKTLFVARSTMDEIRKKQEGIFSILQDSLFGNATIITDEAMAGGGSNHLLVLGAGSGMRSQYRVDRIAIKMNMEAKSIQEIRVDFLPGSKLRSATMEYRKVEWLKSTPEFEQPILDIAFGKNGKTLPQYEGYLVIDRRGEE